MVNLCSAVAMDMQYTCHMHYDQLVSPSPGDPVTFSGF